MSIEIKAYIYPHPSALAVRVTVFVAEQGFHDEFDETDSVATHFVAYESGEPVGVCRVFVRDGGWVLGRFAVLAENRGRGIGRMLIAAAEEYVRAEGGAELSLHSQLRASEFYAKCGYTAVGEPYLEEGCPHITMKKEL